MEAKEGARAESFFFLVLNPGQRSSTSSKNVFERRTTGHRSRHTSHAWHAVVDDSRKFTFRNLYFLRQFYVCSRLKDVSQNYSFMTSEEFREIISAGRSGKKATTELKTTSSPQKIRPEVVHIEISGACTSARGLCQHAPITPTSALSSPTRTLRVRESIFISDTDELHRSKSF